jgi:hypothetical protein
MFVDPKARVAVTDGQNTVYIRAKMDAGRRAQVLDEMRMRGFDGEVKTGELSGLGSYQMLLRVHNVVAWEGPDFLDAHGKPVPCTRANILLLDPTTPLYELVGTRIGELNKDAQVPDEELEQDPN